MKSGITRSAGFISLCGASSDACPYHRGDAAPCGTAFDHRIGLWVAELRCGDSRQSRIRQGRSVRSGKRKLVPDIRDAPVTSVASGQAISALYGQRVQEDNRFKLECKSPRAMIRYSEASNFKALSSAR